MNNPNDFVTPKDLKKAVTVMLNKYRYERNGKLQTAKVKIDLKLHDFLYSFILQDGCHWGFCTGNGLRYKELDYYITHLEEKMLEYAAAKNITVIPVEKTWEMGKELYG